MFVFLKVVDLDMREENGSSKSQYVESAEWKLQDVKKERNALKYSCCDNELADISITIVMDRKPLFYLFNLVIPCIIILSMILLGFFLPPESGERITLSITVLLAMAVFLQLVGESLPRNSETVPLLGKFYITIMAEISISLMLTCWVLNIHYHGSGSSAKEVPVWARVVVLQWLGYLLCVGKPDGSSPDVPNPDLRYHQDDKRKGGPFAVDWETTFAPAANCHCTRCMNARGAHFSGERSPDETRLLEVRYTTDTPSVDFPELRIRERPKEKLSGGDKHSREKYSGTREGGEEPGRLEIFCNGHGQVFLLGILHDYLYLYFNHLLESRRCGSMNEAKSNLRTTFYFQGSQQQDSRRKIMGSCMNRIWLVLTS